MTSPDGPAERVLESAEQVQAEQVQAEQVQAEQVQAEQAGPVASGPAQRIASHLGALATLDSRPLAEHADVFHRVHAELQAALAEIDGT